MWRCLGLLAALPLLAYGQASVEYAAGAARAAGTAAAGANAAGKAIGGALQKLGDKAAGSETAAPAARPATSKPSRPKQSTAAPSPPSPAKAEPAPSYEDPFGIEKGMDAPTVRKRFGPPSLQLSTGGEETLSYVAKNGSTVDVTLTDGKVTTVQKSGQAPAPSEPKLP